MTVAEKLSEMSGIPLFHNHLSRDIVKDIYGDKLRENYQLVDTIRLDVFEYCAKNGTDLIFTYVYQGEEDDDEVRRFIDSIERNGGQVRFVELTADREDLINRVDDESRRRFKKLSDQDVMVEITKDMSIYSIPFVEALNINTSHKTPDEAARLIQDTLGLSK